MKKIIKPTRLTDLAKMLNLSAVTVSKALRNHPDISAGTTERVKKLARKVGYVPNMYARNLSTQKTNTIGLVLPRIAHVFFASIIDELYKVASENDFEIILMVSRENAQRENLHLQTLLSMRVNGLIVSVTQETKDLAIFHKIKKSGTPLVFIDRAPQIDHTTKVMVDDKKGAYTAIEYAFHKGYNKIAHIGGYNNLNIARLRHEGFLEAMMKYGIPVHNYWDIEGSLDEENGYNAFMGMVNDRKIPEYVFADTYPIALGISTAANETGIRIPEDIEITCFGKNTFNQYIPSVFNFINQPTAELAKKSFELLLKQIQDGSRYKQQSIFLPTELITHNTYKKILTVA